MDWAARGVGLRVGGHRGSSALAPENTMAAFERSVTDGALYAETDIRRTADGALVLLHDATVDRTTDGRGPISELTLADARTLDAGGWYGASFAGQHILELDEFLGWVEGQPSFGAALEVKAVSVGAEVAQRAWASAARLRLAIYSFLPEEIRAAKAAQPQMPCVLLLRLTDDPAEVLSWIEACGADGADVPWQWNALEVLAAMRERGMVIGGGSATGDQAAQELLDQGVDMIDTDDPAAMLATVARLGGGVAKEDRAGAS
jgi:glycerophosphoryl diester phosphodiesterase